MPTMMPLAGRRVLKRELTASRVTASTRGVANFHAQAHWFSTHVDKVGMVGGAVRCPSLEVEMYVW